MGRGGDSLGSEGRERGHGGGGGGGEGGEVEAHWGVRGEREGGKEWERGGSLGGGGRGYCEMEDVENGMSDWRWRMGGMTGQGSNCVRVLDKHIHPTHTM